MGFLLLFISWFTSLLLYTLVSLVRPIYLVHKLQIMIQEIQDGTSYSSK